jgi:glyoxylase-like metal-dependent hydrolase (beta-lactamase superfamily II)
MLTCNRYTRSDIRPIADPHPVKIADGIHLVCGAELTHPWDANGMLVVGGGHKVLIDPGSIEGLPNLERNLRALGVSLEDITMILATHGHWDHLGSVNVIRERSGAKLYLHRNDRRGVERGDRDLTAAFLYDRDAEPIKVDRLLHDGQQFQLGPHLIKVMHTPGHTPGSVSLQIETAGRKILFAGDTVAGGISEKIHSQPKKWPGSLRRLIAEEPDGLIMGHAPAREIKDAVGHLEEALDQYECPYVNPWFRAPSRGYRY